MSYKVRVFVAIALVAALQAIPASPALARTAALSLSWSAVESDLVDWPSGQFGLNGFLGPLGSNLYFVMGAGFGHDSGPNLTSVGAYLNLRYMLPSGDRLIPFFEGGLIGTVLRIDVLDRTDGGSVPVRDRTTYLRGGFQIGAGFDLALGSSWSVTAGFRTVRLGNIDTELIPVGGRVLAAEKDPSYWELPRIAIVYWY